MPRTLKPLLLFPALTLLLCAAEARGVVQADEREELRTLTQAVAGEKKKDPDAWFRLGIEYNRAGDTGKARDAFKQALKLRPTFNAARAGLAYTFFVEKNFNEAEKEAYRGTLQEARRGTASGQARDFPATHVLTAVRLQRYREVAAAALEHADAALAKIPDAADWNLLKAETLIALSIPEQKIPPDLSFPTPPAPPPDDATRAENRRRDKEAADCLEKYLRLTPLAANGDHLREQLEALRYYSQEPDSAPAADRFYASSEITTKALISYKPEPGFTPEARRAGLIGMVRLRATLAPDGKIRHVLVVMPLPHGMTEQAVRAAREIKFTPATVKGVPVSQHVILEYHFGIY